MKQGVKSRLRIPRAEDPSCSMTQVHCRREAHQLGQGKRGGGDCVGGNRATYPLSQMFHGALFSPAGAVNDPCLVSTPQKNKDKFVPRWTGRFPAYWRPIAQVTFGSFPTRNCS